MFEMNRINSLFDSFVLERMLWEFSFDILSENDIRFNLNLEKFQEIFFNPKFVNNQSNGETSKFKEVGGLDEDNLAVAYNDIDLCLKLIDKGYLNVFTPHCVAIHHESISRGYEDTPEKLDRLIKEQNHFLNKWNDFLEKGDPFYNPNLSLKNERFSLKFRD